MLVYRACSHIYVYTTMAASIPALYLRVLRNIYGWAYKVDSNTVVTPLLMVLQNNKPLPILIPATIPLRISNVNVVVSRRLGGGRKIEEKEKNPPIK